MTHKRLAMAVVASVGAVLLVGASAITRVTAQTRQAPTFQVDSTWQQGQDVTVSGSYPYEISVLGLVVKSGTLHTTVTERVE